MPNQTNPNDNRDVFISLRLTGEQHEMLKGIAAQYDVSMSRLIRLGFQRLADQIERAGSLYSIDQQHTA